MTKDMQTKQLLCWSGMTDTEHRATSSSNEEELFRGESCCCPCCLLLVTRLLVESAANYTSERQV